MGVVAPPFADVAHAAPLSFSVNTTGNAPDTFADGICDTSATAGSQCTLRGAIQEANANSGADTITFSLATPYKITLASPGLPAITSPVTIDGSTLPGYSPAGGTIVRVDGSSNTTGIGYGFDVQPGGDGTTIKGLEIVRFGSAGIRLASNGSTVAGNYIGTTAANTVNCAAGVLCSTNIGVSIEDGSNNVIGGTTATTRNIISNNSAYGIQVNTTSGAATNNVISGNYIGTSVDGSAALPNGWGVVVNSYGGTPPSGTAIGGTATGAGNLISGNNSNGVDLSAGTTTIEGNIVGLKANGNNALPNNGTAGIYVAGTASAVIGGATSASRNVVSGNGQEGIESGSTTGTLTVRNNYIGTDITGTIGRGNNYNGLYLPSTDNLVVRDNLISGNATATGGGQLQIDYGRNAQVRNNIIGLAADGATVLAGAYSGIYLNTTSDTVVSGNTIAGANSQGIYAGGTDGLVVTSNNIGTDVTGTANKGNSTGIYVDNSSQATIGRAGEGNLISGNTSYGVNMVNTVDSSIAGNRIGTDAAGTSALGNTMSAIWLNSSSRIDIGGTGAGDGNVIGGVAASCCESGIYLSSADDNRVLGNRIGTFATGGALPNGGPGIFIDTYSDANQIGDGTTAGANTVANSNDAGLVIYGRGNRVRGNSIRDNGTLGIDLQWDGVSANDAGDGDGGGNRLQNYPTLTTSASNAGGTQVAGSLATRANRSYVIDFFANTACDGSGNGEGETYLGSKTVTTDGSGNASFTAQVNGSAPAGSFVSATATDVGLGDTSEFTSCVTNQGGLPAASVANVSASEGAGTLDFTVTLSGPPVLTPVTVDYQTANGTATAGSDYTAASGTVTFTGSQTVQTVSVPLTNDLLDELDETLTVTLSNPSNALIAAGQGTATGTITDNDAAPGITVLDAANATEPDTGSVNQNYTVKLSAASALPVSVTVVTAPNTATAEADYATNAVHLEFAPGQITKTFTVAVLGDLVDEPTERYFARLFGPSNATLADDSGQGNILDNDPQPAVSISDVTDVEGNATKTFTFVATLSAPSERKIIVNVRTNDGTALAGSDYNARTNGGAGIGLQFLPGATTANFLVTIRGNTVAEPDETFTVDVVSATNATVGDGQGVGTILNDD